MTDQVLSFGTARGPAWVSTPSPLQHNMLYHHVTTPTHQRHNISYRCVSQLNKYFSMKYTDQIPSLLIHYRGCELNV